jgi:hypothetical protein
MAFSGFPKQTVRFLADLSSNNDKRWFDAHREDYERYFVDPARDFVDALGPCLKKLDREIQAVAKVNGSIMRINRDIRFSKDKTPYKDHLDLWFWSGDKRGWGGSGFFFRLTSAQLILGAGTHAFAPPVNLPRFGGHPERDYSRRSSANATEKETSRIVQERRRSPRNGARHEDRRGNRQGAGRQSKHAPSMARAVRTGAFRSGASKPGGA